MSSHRIEQARAEFERLWRLPTFDPREPSECGNALGMFDPPTTGPAPPLPQGLRLAGILAGLLFPSTRRPRP